MNIQTLLDDYHIRIKIEDVLELWNASHRAYHTETHLRDLLEQINAYPNLLKKDQDILSLAAVFHDIIYEPQRSDNEERSAQFLLDHASKPCKPEIHQVVQMIRDTADHVPKSPLSIIFCAMDMSIVLMPYEKLLEWEKGIRHEYSYLPLEHYKQRRIAFLNSMCAKYPDNSAELKRLIDYVRN